jgi:hypothetical protein
VAFNATGGDRVGGAARERTLSEGSVRRQGADGQGRTRIVVTGRLDAASSDDLTSLCAAIVEERPQGIAFDLTEISGATDDGVEAMSECLAVGRTLTGGVDIAVASSAGRQLLLATLAGA